MDQEKPTQRLQFDLKTLIFGMVLASLTTAFVVSSFTSHQRIRGLENRIREIETDTDGQRELKRLQYELAEIKTKYGASHPVVKSKELQIKIMKEHIAKTESQSNLESTSAQ